MSDRIAAAQKEAEEEERRMAAAKARLERLSRKVSAPQTVDDGAGVVPTLASVEERAQAARTAAPDKAQTATATIGTAAASEQAAIEKANEAKEAAARAVAAARLAVDTAVAGADAFVVRQKVEEEAASLGVPAMTSTERAQQQEQVSSESLSEAWDGVTTQVQTSLADLSGRMHMCANQMMRELPPSMTKCISNVYDFGTPYSDDGSQYVRSPALTNGTPKRAPVREPEFFEWLFTCGSCASPRRSTDAAF